MILRRYAAALPALLVLAGCGDTAGYPSLAPRAVERSAMQAEPVPGTAAPVPAPSPASADVAQILATAQKADADFKAALEKARGKIAAGRGAAQGSDAWVEGQQAYSLAEATRAPITDALAELDKRHQAAIDAGSADEEAALADALLQVQALDEAEQAMLAQLMPA